MAVLLSEDKDFNIVFSPRDQKYKSAILLHIVQWSLWKLVVSIILVMAEKCISLVFVIEMEKQKFNYVKSGGTAFWPLFFREIVLLGLCYQNAFKKACYHLHDTTNHYWFHLGQKKLRYAVTRSVGSVRTAQNKHLVCPCFSNNLCDSFNDVQWNIETSTMHIYIRCVVIL